MIARLRTWAKQVRSDALALFLAARDPRTPAAAKLVALCVAAYALSPIDLIPDFIPVLGLLDEAVLLPLGILLAVRLIPPPLMAEFRARAGAMMERPRSRAAAAAIILLWAGLALLAAVAFLRLARV